jgi:hypothetical protein
MAILTFAEASKLSPDKLYEKVLYGAVAEDAILANMNLEFHTGNEFDFYQTTTLPTSSWRIETDTMTSTAPTRVKRRVAMKNVYTQAQVPPYNVTALSNVINQQAELVRDMSRSFGAAVRACVTKDSEYSVAIGATATTKGIDKFIPCPGLMDTPGLVYLDFDDTADTIAMSTDGTTYGTAVSTTADLDTVPLYDGVAGRTHLHAWVTMDVSDSEGGGDWATTNAATGVTLSSSKKANGLTQWCDPAQVIWGTLGVPGAGVAPTSTGDALAYKQLDALLDLVPGADCFVMPKRTRRSLKALLQASNQYETTDVFMGRKLARKVLAYESLPVWVTDVPLTGTIGVGAGTLTTGTSVFALKFARNDRDDGFAIRYHSQGGPSVRVNDWGEETSQPVPGYFRDVGEMETLPDHIFRLDGYFAPVLRNTQAMAECRGIKD